MQRFVLTRMVKGANSTLLVACMGSLLFSSLIAYVGCRSLPLCGCYDSANGMVGEIFCNAIKLQYLVYTQK